MAWSYYYASDADGVHTLEVYQGSTLERELSVGSHPSVDASTADLQATSENDVLAVMYDVATAELQTAADTSVSDSDRLNALVTWASITTAVAFEQIGHVDTRP